MRSSGEMVPPRVRAYSCRSRVRYITVGDSMIVTPLAHCRPSTALTARQNSLRQIYGPRCEITVLREGEEEYLPFTVPPFSSMTLSHSSTHTSAAPYSAEILYGGDINKAGGVNGGEDYRFGQSGLLDLEQSKEIERDRQKCKEHRKGLSSRNSHTNSLSAGSLEKDERTNPSGLPPPNGKKNIFKPNGLRNSLVSKGRGSQDDLVAMGTIWSPNTQSKPVRTISVCTNSNSTTSTTANPRRVSSMTVPTIPFRPPFVLPNTHPSGASKLTCNNVEAKYGDPIAGAPPVYQQRLAELANLESETVRYERTRKMKKKMQKADRDS